MNLWKHIILFFGSMLIMTTSAFAESWFAHLNESNITDLISASYTESKLRELGSTNPRRMLEKLFSPGAATKWRSFTDRDCSEEQIKDFFIGAILFRGPVSERGAIAAFYNPFWDAILITESFAEQIPVKGKLETIRKVNDFSFLSGAAFRGKMEQAESVLQDLASPQYSISYVICSLFAETKKKFDDLYGNQKLPLLLEIENEKSDQDWKRILSASALRLTMVSSLVKNKEDYREIRQLAGILQKGKISAFHLLFSSDYAKMMSQFFVKLPPRVRADFEPYAYYPDRKGGKIRCYVYVNSRYPRLFAVMVLGTGYGKTTFEWFDLAYAGQIRDVFESAVKEAEK